MNGKNRNQRVALLGGFAVMAVTVANAQTDITGVMSSLNAYLTSAVAVGVAILLFTLGRAIVRKVAR